MFTKKITATPATDLTTAIECLKSRQAERTAAVARLRRAEDALRVVDEHIAAVADPAEPLHAELARLAAAERMDEAPAGSSEKWTVENLKRLAVEREEVAATTARRSALVAERAALSGILSDAAMKLAALPVPLDETVLVFDALLAAAGADVLDAADVLLARHRRAVALAHLGRQQTSIAIYKGGALARREAGETYYAEPLADDGTMTTTRLGIVQGQDRDRREAINEGFRHAPADNDIAAAVVELEAMGLRLLPASERRIDEAAAPDPIVFDVRAPVPAGFVLP